MRWTCYRVVIKKPVQKELKWSDIPSKTPKKEKNYSPTKLPLQRRKQMNQPQSTKGLILSDTSPPVLNNFEKVNPESLYALQGSFGADSRADTLLADEIELNDSLGF